MVNSKIKIKCKCGKEMTINVKSIEKMNDRIKFLEAEVKRLNTIIASERLMNQTDDNKGFMGMFNDMFGK